MARRRVVVRPVPIEPPRRDKRTEKKRQERTRKRAEELHEQGMPFQMAMAVAHGKLELNDALERMARNDQITKLMRKHELSRALATQIAMGQADLDRVLYRRRMEEHRADNRERSVFDEALASGSPVVVGLHGKKEERGAVTAVDTYTVQLGDSGEAIHKLQVKYVYDPDDSSRVDAARSSDEALSREPREPVSRPQDRYPLSDKRLYRYVDNKAAVQATTLEGEQFTGQVAWFSRYEVSLTHKGRPLLTVFRHALADLREA